MKANKDLKYSYIYNSTVTSTHGWKTFQDTWENIIKMLSTCVMQDYTRQEYLDNKKQLAHKKDIGCILFGNLEGDVRKEDYIIYRDIIALDIDDCDESIWDKINKIPYEHFWHTTHSHTEENPRIRIFLPLKETIMNKSDYRIITQELSRKLGFKQLDSNRWEEIDRASFKYNQVMFLPSTPIDVNFKSKHVEGKLVDPKEFLLTPEQDKRKVKYAAKKTIDEINKKDKIDLNKKLGGIKSPHDMPENEVIHKFCSKYNIHEVIEKFLDDVYKKGTQKECYTYCEGSTENGLKVYPDKKGNYATYAYSFHNTDPLNDDHCHNGFNMLKIHRFKGDVTKTIKYVKENLGYKNVEAAFEVEAGHEADYHYYDDNGKLKLNYKQIVEHLANDPEHKTFNTENGFYIYKDGVYKSTTYNMVKKFIAKHLHEKYQGTSPVNEVFNRLLREEEKIDILNKKDNLIVFNNCVLEFNKKGIYEIKEHSLEYMNTHKFYYDFNPDIHCSVWEKFLNEVLPKDQQKLLQEIIGYIMLPSNKIKKFYGLYGVGDSGKSLILNTLVKILGKESVAAVTLQKLANPNLRFASAPLYGKLANVVGDLSSAPLKDTSLIKMLTGEDLTSGERKGLDPFEFYNKARLICSMNNLPPTYDKNNEFFNRFIIIPFETAIPKEDQDEHLIDKFDMIGVINWAIKGLQRLLSNKLKFSTNEKNDSVILQYKKDNNNVLQFIDDALIEEENNNVKSIEMYNWYKLFCKENGYSPLGRNKFINEAKLCDIEYSENCFDKDGKKFRGFKNIKLKDQAKEDYIRIII
ncbi:MAG: phage/plasmid primase, P4 family [Gammaproteobacteria bacterium]|jgi:P4 family phage/plasmid primase-like protien